MKNLESKKRRGRSHSDFLSQGKRLDNICHNEKPPVRTTRWLTCSEVAELERQGNT